MDMLTKVARDHEEESENHFTEADSGQKGPEHTFSSSNPPSDNESHSSWEHEDERRALQSHKRPTRKVPPTTINHEHQYSHDYNIQGSSKETHRRAWYELDSAVLLALISPAGNWLTGGDHIKNLLFIALLVFYLHQVIEVPWELYQKAQRRNQPPDLPPLNSEDRYHKLAISELRKVEMLCLALTVVSPFLGASLLRCASCFILGPESISWFSTGLFVMAAGIRPWSHLIERLNQRTEDLQDFIHHPPSSSHIPIHDLQKDTDALNKRIHKLERSFNGMKDRLKVTSEEIFDQLDDALDSVRCSLRKHQKRWDEQDERLRFMEKSITTLSGLKSGVGKRSGFTMLPRMTITAVQSIFSKWALSPLQWLGGRFNHKLRRSPRLPANGVTVPARLEIIQEEEYNTTAILLSKPIEIPVRILYFFGFVVFLPFRLAVRILFRR